MRDIDSFNRIADVAKVQQYLYADPNNKIDVVNAVDAPLRLTMRDDFVVMARNMNFPDGSAFEFSGSLAEWDGILEQLENQPSEKPGAFKSRWEEIKFELAAIAVRNPKHRKYPKHPKIREEKTGY